MADKKTHIEQAIETLQKVNDDFKRLREELLKSEDMLVKFNKDARAAGVRSAEFDKFVKMIVKMANKGWPGNGTPKVTN